MAVILPKSIKLKSGESAAVRSAVVDDAPRLIELIKSNLTHGTGMATRPEEFTLTLEQEREWIIKHAEGPAWLVLVCEVGGRLVGCLSFENNPNRQRLAHHGTMGMGVHVDWRGKGVGEALLQTLLDWAAENPLVEKVSLVVFADNTPAIALYRKLGFVEEGRRYREVKRGENDYVDDILMYKWVK